jgi:hypothetical protein
MVKKILTSGSKARWACGFIFLAISVLLGCEAEGNEINVLSENVITTSNAVVHQTWDGGSNSPTSGVSYTFTGLSTQQYTYTLTVEVYATDFFSSTEYVNSISAGSTTLSSFCNPGVDSGGYYHTCVTDRDVTSAVSSGSLVIRTTATSEINCCAYSGYYLYVKVTLTPSLRGVTPTPTSQPTSSASTSATLEGGTNSPASGLTGTFYGLDTSAYTNTLDMEVYETEFLSSNEYVSSIYAGYIQVCPHSATLELTMAAHSTPV